MAGPGGVNMEKFEEYFQRADVDRDGRISGGEAVSFLLGSNLPRPVLAQIWNHVDQNRSGFLSRPEFYNALKLVTVAQSKRDLTPDIVKAALYGPASSKIPPPQISTAATPVQQPNSIATSSLPQTGVTPQPRQNFGFRGPAPSNTSVSPQVGALPSSTGMRPVGPMPSSSGQSPHYGSAPSTSGVYPQFAQTRPSSIMNQQFGQVQPTNTMMNQQFGQLQLQPSSTGINQQFRPPSSTTYMNQQFFPLQGNQTMRPSQSLPTLNASRPPQATGSSNISRSVMGSNLPNLSSEFLGGKTGAASTGQVTQGLDKGARSSSMPVAPNPQDLLSAFSSSAANDDRGLVRSASDPMFAGGSFSDNQSSSLQVSPVSQPLTNSLPTSSVVSPVTSTSQSSVKPDPFEALQSTLMKPSSGIPASQRPSLPKSNQQTPNQVTSSALSPGVQARVGNSTSEQSQMPWPKMTHTGIQKYAKVFMEVDSDRDGKITGDQARNLFLSWRLPREVLKQVWDLADQDSDSMLSLREFCVALYLMERYREGRTLPPTLPNSVMLDETLLSLAGPPSTYGSMGWATTTGLRPQQALPDAQPIARGRPPMQPVVSQSDAFMQFNQQNARGPLVNNSLANQPNNGEAYTMDTKGLEAEETDEKVDDKENVILDSREKLEFYRTKMQDLVLYKSRCDNRLNEITERARADKTEAELLEKKYQEKYKQVAEIHSKLAIEEATFREIQERKTELQQAITKMEQGGSADGILQVRADRIQSDLEELLKALTERCKKHSMEIQASSLVEIPTGWQPGIPEAAAVWDEEWDKFDDEGFSLDTVVPANVETKSDRNENSSPTHSLSPDSVSNAAMSDKLFGLGAFDTESLNSADESRSPHGSPGRQTIPETPSQEHSENHFRKSSDGDTETHRSFDDSTWGNFDNNDDVDSIWGFNAKESDHGKHDEKYFFGSTDFGGSPGQKGSPQADSSFQKSSPFFEDSVPGSPISRAGHSPKYSVDSRDPFFDNFSRFDSFRTHDAGSSSRPEGLTRFDSINSTKGFDHSSNYSFNDSDPFGSSGPFKVSSETPKKGSESRSAF